MSKLQNNSRKWLIIPALAITVATGGVLLTSNVASASESDMAPKDTMMSRFATKFGLDETAVKDFFEATREEHQAERKAERETKLSEAVSAGVITQEQKELLLNKQSENMEKRQSQRLDGETPRMGNREEMEAEREANQAEMKKWAEENGIDLEALHEFMGDGFENQQGPRGHRGGF